jgi:hypothetical protein
LGAVQIHLRYVDPLGTEWVLYTILFGFSGTNDGSPATTVWDPRPARPR